MATELCTYVEDDQDQGVQRTYCYTQSSHTRTEKQEVRLLESPVWKKMLFLDGVLQSTTQDEVVYHNALVHPLMDTLTKKSSILILGGGEGATAREVLRWEDVYSVTMVDYDKELVTYMKEKGSEWACSSLYNSKLQILYEDAWNYIDTTTVNYAGVIIDLTDPDRTRESWMPLLQSALLRVRQSQGGIVLNAGLYLPWKKDTLLELYAMVKELCSLYKEFNYYMYTAFIPSFHGEWTFIVVSHSKRTMIAPTQLQCIPAWIRRSIVVLDTTLLMEPVDTNPIVTPIKSRI